MSTLTRFYPGDRAVEFFLIVMVGAALLSSAGWVISWILRRKPATRHLVLYGALISCLALPALACLSTASGVTLISVPILLTENAPRESMPARIEPDPNVTSRQGPNLHSSTAVESTDPNPPQFRRPAFDPAALLADASRAIDESVESSVPVVASENAPSAAEHESTVPHALGPAGIPASFRVLVALALFVWGGGCLLLLVSLVWGFGRVVQLRRASHDLQNESLRFLLNEVANRLGVHPAPRLLVSPRMLTPIAVGFGRPAVILPERLFGALSDNQIRDVLVHEVAHIQRHDHLTVLLQGLARALYWPLVSVHGLNRALELSREELCDNVVLAVRDAVSYGETLLRIAELSLRAGPMAATVGIMHWKGKLERRIAGLLDPARSKTTRSGRGVASAVICIFLALASTASATRLIPTLTPAAPAADTATIDASADAESANPAPANAVEPSAPQTQKPAAVADSDAPKLVGRFSGRVTGPDGKPFRGARIYIIPIDSEFNTIHPVNAAIKISGLVRAETDADGRFEFDATDMTYTDLEGLPARRKGLLSAKAEGLAPDWMMAWGQNQTSIHSHWDPIKGAALNLQLATDDVPIHGRFLDPDGQPLAGALVRLTGLMIPQRRDLDAHLDREVKYHAENSTDYERELGRLDLLPALVTETRTDADGRFTIAGLGRDRLAQLKVTAPSVVDTHLTVMTRDVPDVRIRLGGGVPLNVPGQLIHGAGFSLKLEPGRTISGVVRDLNSKRPIPGMWVALRSRSMGGYLSADKYPWVTDENGRFMITGLYPTTKSEGIVVVSAPGMKFRTSSGEVEGDAEVAIECGFGIPFRLNLVDEQGQPVEAEVTFTHLWPNPHTYGGPELNPWPASRAARQPDGTYEGFVLPGPGAVLVKTQKGSGCRPAYVDPKAFFMPGWTAGAVKEEFLFYGTQDVLATGTGGRLYQDDYAAIVLVNPPNSIAQQELSATVIKDRPRQVFLIDADGRPVTGVQTQGMTLDPYDTEPRQRSADFLITKQHPERVRRTTFVQEQRQLIGFLMARGDGDTPYTVRMQPWGTVTGRIVDENGNALPIQKPESDWIGAPKLLLSRDGDPEVNAHAAVETDAQGRFRVDQLVPGRHYSARISGGRGGLTDTAFEDVVVGAGEACDLGDIRTSLPFGPEYRRHWVGDEQETAKIPAEAWGAPVNGLRMAIVLQSPPVDKHERLRYEIVAENVSDRDIRFSAAIHYENGYHKIELVDASGKQPLRQAGPPPDFVDGPNLVRFWLKPKGRIVISPCATQLVKLDDADQPIPSPKRNPFYHHFQMRPGRYSVSAAVELGQRIEHVDKSTGTRSVRSPLEGEWTGKLQTGVVPVRLFEDAGM